MFSNSFLLSIIFDFSTSLVFSFIFVVRRLLRWLGRRVVSVLDSGAERARVQIAVATLSGNSLRQTVQPIVLLFTKQQNW